MSDIDPKRYTKKALLDLLLNARADLARVEAELADRKAAHAAVQNAYLAASEEVRAAGAERTRLNDLQTATVGSLKTLMREGDALRARKAVVTAERLRHERKRPS